MHQPRATPQALQAPQSIHIHCHIGQQRAQHIQTMQPRQLLQRQVKLSQLLHGSCRIGLQQLPQPVQLLLLRLLPWDLMNLLLLLLLLLRSGCCV
jgi:hypothetical protein